MTAQRIYYWKKYRGILPILLLLLIASISLGLLSDVFFSSQNIYNLFSKAASAQIMACGVTLLMIAGQLDLSGGAVIALSAVLGLEIMQMFHLPAVLGILLTLLFATLMGGISGFCVARLHMPSLLTTLALMRMFRGIALKVLEGTKISGISTGYRWLGTATWSNGITVSAVLVLVLVLVMQLVLQKTVFGYHVRAIGENRKVAASVGIPVSKICLILFVAAGFLYGVAGVVFAGRIGVVNSTLAEGQELTVLAGVILGGCSLSGGKGTFLGGYLGILFLSMIDNGINLLNISSYWSPLLHGLIIFLAVFKDTYHTIGKKRRLADVFYFDSR